MNFLIRVQLIACHHDCCQQSLLYNNLKLNYKKSSCRYDSRLYWLSVTLKVIQG